MKANTQSFGMVELDRLNTTHWWVRLLIWAAIVVPIGLGGLKVLQMQNWGAPAALSHPSTQNDLRDPRDLRDTFVPTPNQPPVFTRGSGTR